MDLGVEAGFSSVLERTSSPLHHPPRPQSELYKRNEDCKHSTHRGAHRPDGSLMGSCPKVFWI